MEVLLERRITIFAERPDPSRHLWVGFVEVMDRFAGGGQTLDVRTFDESYPTEAAARAAAEAWVVRYQATHEPDGPPLTVVRL